MATPASAAGPARTKWCASSASGGSEALVGSAPSVHAIRRCRSRRTDPGSGRVEHVADQRVREAPRSARCARLHQDVRGDRLVEQQHELARGALLERCDQVEGDFDADDRSAGKQLPARVAQPGKPPADDGLHAFGDPEGLACAIGRPAKASFIGEEPDEFADEQRIPLGLAMDRLGETVGRTLRRSKFDVARHLIHGQSRRIEALCGRHAGDFGEQADPWVSGGQLTLPVDGQHHDAGVGQVHGHEPEQQQRRLVGGVEVVEDQDDGTVARGVPQQARERVEQLEAGAIGVVVLRDQAARGGRRGPPAGPARGAIRPVRRACEGRQARDPEGGSAPPGARASRPARRPLPSIVPRPHGHRGPALRPRTRPRGASCRYRLRPTAAPGDRGPATRSRVRPAARPSLARGRAAFRRRCSAPETHPQGCPSRSRDLQPQEYGAE